ncbi:hypothetical protein, partial [Paracoccus denitrificans]
LAARWRVQPVDHTWKQWTEHPELIICAGSVSKGSNGLSSSSLRDSKWQVWLNRGDLPPDRQGAARTARRTHPMLRDRILRMLPLDWRCGEILTRSAAPWDGTGLRWLVFCKPFIRARTCLLSFSVMVS